jgi:hypothetical protein
MSDYAYGRPTNNDIEIARLTRELAEARAVVDKLPKTKDGVPVVAGITIFCPNGHPLDVDKTVDFNEPMAYCDGDGCFSTGDPMFGSPDPARYELDECFSALEAAEALADEKGRPEPPTPTRKSWPRGLWAPIEAGELPDVFDDTEREALALALNEFPAAVAILREDQRMWPKAVPETHPARTHFTNRDDFLTRVDAAGFDL